MSNIQPGDRVIFQHSDPDVVDPNNGLVGTVLEVDATSRIILDAFFGKGSVRVKFDRNDSDGYAVCLANEVTKVVE